MADEKDGGLFDKLDSLLLTLVIVALVAAAIYMKVSGPAPITPGGTPLHPDELNRTELFPDD